MGVVIKSWTTDGTMIIEGMPVYFGGADRDGERFTFQTDFWLENVPSKIPVLWAHGKSPDLGKRVLGFVSDLKKTTRGLRATMRLDNLPEVMANKIAAMIESKTLGMSSGSVTHLVERVGNEISSWPLAEISLLHVDYAAEPKTAVGLSRVKEIAQMKARLDDIERKRDMADAMERWESKTGDEAQAGMLTYEVLELEQAVIDDDRLRGAQRESEQARKVKRLERLKKLEERLSMLEAR